MIIIGATGYTGKYLTKYYTKNYGINKSFKWCIAGRTLSRLEKLKQECQEINPEMSELKLLKCDNSNYEDMKLVANSTKVVVSCAGPFAIYGTPLVNCCAAYGTDYVDITGEIDWIRDTIVKFQDLAILSGARIVSCVGFDCAPFDLMVYKLRQELQNAYNDSELTSVEIWDVGVTNISMDCLSGGTLKSLLNSFSNKSAPIRRNTDPLNWLNDKHGTSSTYKSVHNSMKRMNWNKLIQRWCGFGFIILQNFRAVQRSNCLLGYSKKLNYKESIVFPSLRHGLLTNFMEILIGTVFSIKP